MIINFIKLILIDMQGKYIIQALKLFILKTNQKPNVEKLIFFIFFHCVVWLKKRIKLKWKYLLHTLKLKDTVSFRLLLYH